MDMSGSLSITDPDQLSMDLVGKKINMLGSVFRMYTTKVVPVPNKDETNND